MGSWDNFPSQPSGKKRMTEMVEINKNQVLDTRIADFKHTRVLEDGAERDGESLFAKKCRHFLARARMEGDVTRIAGSMRKLFAIYISFRLF